MFAQKQAMISRASQPATSSAAPRRNDQAHATPSLADYAARRGYAFDQAEEAYWEGAICAESYMLFRLLTRLCKERAYCWPGLDYLAARFQTSIGTIKRRLSQLERAELIERRQRTGGLTSYTYIMPLQRYDAENQASQRDAVPQAAVIRRAPTRKQAVAKTDADKRCNADPTPHEADHAPLFFVPTERINAGLLDRSALIPQTIKNQSLNAGGGGIPGSVETAASDPVTTLLTESGVLSPHVLAELKDTPLADVAACLNFAHRQRNIVDPAAFAVSLLRQGLGPKLAQQPRRRPLSADVSPASPDDPAGYGYYHCTHGQIRGSCTLCVRPAVGRRAGSPSVPLPTSAATPLVASEQPIGALWSAALAAIQERLTADDFTAWFSETALLHLDRDRVVLGVPNVFVRERLSAEYEQLIGGVLEPIVGQPLTIQYAIGSS